jgi:hypothetical protein
MKASKIVNGQQMFARSRGAVEPPSDRKLAKTAIGRGQLRYRAREGDLDARAALIKAGRRVDVEADERGAAREGME